MTFRRFAEAVHTRLQYLAQTSDEFYRSDCPDIYERYLAAFPPGTNPLFRERTEHDCQTCKQFIRNLGRLVVIRNGELRTVWGDLKGVPSPYAEVAFTLDSTLKRLPIASIFRTTETSFGRESNLDPNAEIRWYHLYGDTPNGCRHDNPEAGIGKAAARFQVLKRGLEEFRIDDFNTVIELIQSNNIYRGEEHAQSVEAFGRLLYQYEALSNQGERQSAQVSNYVLLYGGNPKSPTDFRKDLFVWANIFSPVARFRNTSIGTLFIDLAEGKDIDTAVRAFESKVAPESYRRPTAVITQSMINQAVNKIRELDLEDSLSRRFASPQDISVNDVLFIDNDIAKLTKDGLTNLLMQEAKPRPLPATAATQEVPIETFLRDWRFSRLEVLLEQRHLGNFVSLTAPVYPGAPSLFQWGNPYAWSYSGGVTDAIRERVKQAGGNVDAKLRVSLAWSNYDDLDIHCRGPRGEVIYYMNKMGILDVDANGGAPTTRTPAENLSWTHPADGRYEITVHNFHQREDCDFGFKLQVQCGATVREYSYTRKVLNKQTINALSIDVQNGEIVTISAHDVTPDFETPTEKWGIKTLTPTRVNMLMLSPNHWENSTRSGNKHYFFILDKCLNPDPTRGFYNEYLVGSLAPYRKVFEVLGSKTQCQPSNDQLSGVGFSSTRSDSLKVMVDGRPLTITF